MIVTVDNDGHERKWGLLSRNTAWRAGLFWDDMKGEVEVFLKRATHGRKPTTKNASIKGGDNLASRQTPTAPRNPRRKE